MLPVAHHSLTTLTITSTTTSATTPSDIAYAADEPKIDAFKEVRCFGSILLSAKPLDWSHMNILSSPLHPAL